MKPDMNHPAAARRQAAAPRPVLRRLLWPLTMLLSLLVAGGGTLLYCLQRQRLTESIAEQIAVTNREFGVDLQNHTAGLALALQVIAADPATQQALRDSDAEALVATWSPQFDQWRREAQLAHLRFTDVQHVCLARVHPSARRSDASPLDTARAAERAGRFASGIELDSAGSPTLWVVCPIGAAGRLVGYAELGKDLANIVAQRQGDAGLHVALTVQKEYLNRERWEAGRRALGREPDWDRLPRTILVTDSDVPVAREFVRWLDAQQDLPGRGETEREIVRDGRTWWCAALPLHDAVGRPFGRLLTLHDISQEKAAFVRLLALGGGGAAILLAVLLAFVYGLLRQTDAGLFAQAERLQEADRRTRLFFEQGFQFVGLLSLEGDFLDANDAGLQFAGTTRAEALGKPFESLPCWQRAPEALRRVRQAIGAAARGELVRFEASLPGPDGGLHDFEVSLKPLRDETGQIIHLMAEGRDVSERNRAETKLRAALHRVRLAADVADIGVWTWNFADDTLELDERMQAWYGGVPESVCQGGQHYEFWRSRVHPADRERAEAVLQKSVRDQTPFDNVFRIVLPDGRIRLMHSAWVFERDAQGKPLRMIGINRDITLQRELEENLRVAKEAADAANSAKSNFLANMSHEIRTPMNGVIGLTGLLLDTELNEQQRQYAETIRSSGEGLLALLNDILDVSKIEAGKLELECLDFDLRSLLDEFAAPLAARAQGKGLEFICAAAPDVPDQLRGDPGRLRQILTNLAGNAVKFTAQGEVCVQASVAEMSAGEVVLRCTVRDTGIGMSLDQQKRLFQKFSQADTSTTRRFGGSGLGLIISKELVERMGGEIGARSHEGAGSEFWFTVRLERPVSAAERMLPPELRGKRVLVVDDNATNREVLLAHLAAWEMQAEATPDGPAALQTLARAGERNEAFDIALIDMQMPGMDGAVLGRAIQADARLQATRLVLMTALGRNKRTAAGPAPANNGAGGSPPGNGGPQGSPLEFAAYLTKPVRHSELYNCLSAVLAQIPTARRPAARPQPAALPPLRRTGARILLAEDNVVNQEVALGMLRKLGQCADAVADGAQALAALARSPYDLVLMDLQMPEMDGLAAARAIRDPGSAVLDHHVPIVAVTAAALRGDRDRCLDAGMNDYITKPVAVRALVDVLNRWLPETNGSPQPAPAPTAAGTSTREAAEPDLPVFDRPGMLERLMNDEALAAIILDRFRESAPRQVAAVRTALAAGDADGIRRAAHSLKGAAANVGGERVRRAAFELEQAGQAGDLQAAGTILAGLEQEFSRLQAVVAGGLPSRR